MSTGEFDWIATAFRPLASAVAGARNLRDDAAVLPVGGLDHLVVSTDVLVEAVHFRPLDPAGLVGRKALRTNLSDMAAMGTCPWVYTLGLAVGAGLDAASWDPGRSRRGWRWISANLVSVLPVATRFAPRGPQCCRSPFSAGRGLTECSVAPMPGRVMISGSPGASATPALGLRVLEGSLETTRTTIALIDRYLLPQPRIALGLALSGLAHAAIDLSDGLLQDLGHVCRESGTAARIRLDTVPLSAPAAALGGRQRGRRARPAGRR